MRLLIDDCPLRRAQFVRAFGHNGTRHPDKPAAWLIMLLADNSYRDIYLDGDLGCGPLTGETLAQLMAGARLHTKARVWVHSSNAAMSQRMHRILEDTHNVQQVTWSEVIGEDEQEQQP